MREMCTKATANTPMLLAARTNNSDRVSVFHREGTGYLQPKDCNVALLSRYVKCKPMKYGRTTKQPKEKTSARWNCSKATTGEMAYKIGDERINLQNSHDDEYRLANH